MDRSKLLIALAVAALLALGLGSQTLISSASVAVLADGQKTNVDVCRVGDKVKELVVVACPEDPSQATEPSLSAPTTQTSPLTTTAPPTTTTAPPDDTPDDEPSGEAQPRKQPTTGAKKGDDKKAKKERDPADEEQGEPSSRDSESARDEADADRDGKRDSDGQPSLSNPTVTIADPGPAPIGVPNFVIDKFKIPPFLLPIYKAAEAEYGIPWQILAAVNEIETDYGRNLSVSSAGALGWMQFMPGTWDAYGTDANGDGRKDPYNPVDAIFAAARYIKAAGGEKDIRKGLFAYNHADWYVDSVLLRAKVIGGLPASLVSSITQLTEGRFPVAARARYADQISPRKLNRRVNGANAAIPVESRAGRTSIDIFSREGAPVIAVNDGEVIDFGESDKLGRYVVLRDYAGNRYVYSQLGSVVSTYPSPKEQQVSEEQIKDELGLNAKADPAPTAPASAGSQPATPTGDDKAADPAPPSSPAPASDASAPAPSVTKERLYANPTRPQSYQSGGRDQLMTMSGSAESFETYGAYFAKVFGLDRDDVEFKPLRKGSRVVAGTILGRIGSGSPAPEDGAVADDSQSSAPFMRFAIRPAGRGAPRIDPKPILDGWKLLESTAIYRAADKNPLVGPDAKAPSIGQMLLMTKEQLGQAVLSDPRIDIYECGRDDIRGNVIDKRVLILLKWLAGNGLRPTISALKCGHTKLVAGSSRISDHWFGRAADIAAVNGIPILGNQQDGGITDITIRRLLELRGYMHPSQIISLRTYAGADNTLSMSNHADHIHAAFGEQPGASTDPNEVTVLKPGQWTKLIDRLGQIENPTVPIKPSKYATPVKGGD